MRYVAIQININGAGSFWAVRDTGIDSAGINIVHVGTQSECEAEAAARNA